MSLFGPNGFCRFGIHGRGGDDGHARSSGFEVFKVMLQRTVGGGREPEELSLLGLLAGNMAS